jgi:repressor LexA
MTTFGERLRWLRKRENLTQEDLGKILNVKKAAISKYESDKVNMNLDSIKIIANYFSVPLDFFVSDNPDIIAKVPRLPILGTIRTNVPLLVQENFAGYLDVIDYIQGDFVIQVTGDSMIEAGILDGDYAICREAETAQNGQIVVTLTSLATGLSKVTLKYYFDNGKEQVLRAANPQIPDIKMEDGVRIVGLMGGLVRKESPGYHFYRDFLAASGNKDWTEVITLASSAGMKTNQVKEILAAQIEIVKKLKEK